MTDLSIKASTAKATILADEHGYDSIDEFTQSVHADPVVPGICMEMYCNISTEVLPDQTQGYCSGCNSANVISIVQLYLAIS